MCADAPFVFFKLAEITRSGRLPLVREIGPKFFVMENVKGMMNWQSGAVLEINEQEIAAPVLLRGDTYQY